MAFAQVKYLLQWLKGGVPTDVTTADRLPVDTGLTVQTDGLTDAELRAAPVVVDTGLTTQTNALTDAELRASEVEVVDAGGAREATQLRRLGGGKAPITATVASSGDTIIHTPAAGKRIRLYWVSAINDPTALSAPIIRILIGATEYYRVYAVAHWEVFTGDPDEELIVNLSTAGNVQVTAHIEEID